jgi:hypothetical protein
MATDVVNILQYHETDPFRVTRRGPVGEGRDFGSPVTLPRGSVHETRLPNVCTTKLEVR